MAVIVTIDDLPAEVRSAELVQLMLDGANAKASRVAPCLAATDPPLPSQALLDEAKLVLVGAIKRWTEAGAGAYQTQTAGPFSATIDTRQRSGFNLWPSEIEQLQDLCKGEKSGAFQIDTAPCLGGSHMPWCALNFNATYCSCGTDLSGGVPLYEGGTLSGDCW